MRRYSKDIWSVIGVLLVSTATIWLGGCQESVPSGKNSGSSTSSAEKEGQSSQEEKSFPEYKLRTHWIDIHAAYAITINGFPVRRLQIKGRASDDEFNVGLNTALIGEGNRAAIRFEPLVLRSGEGLSLGMVEVEADVLGSGEKPIEGVKITETQVDSAYESWSERARKQWEKYRNWEEKWLQEHPDSSSTITARDGGALDSMRQWTARNPLTVSTTFDNEAGPDFSRIFEKAPRLPDTPATRERLLGYAMHLRDLMARKDTAGLVKEFLPVVWTGMDSLDTTNLRSNFSEKQIRSVREHIVMENAYVDITRSEIGLRRWAEGRVWELYYEPDGKALFGARTFRKGTPEYTGSGRKREVYVAELGEELKVVR
jgi:hypothetical protein